MRLRRAITAPIGYGVLASDARASLLGCLLSVAVSVCSTRPCGGRTWWAHFEFTPINTTPTILRKKIEEPLIVGALRVDSRGPHVKTARCVSRSIRRRVREIVEWSSGAHSSPTPRKSRNASESAARHAMPHSESMPRNSQSTAVETRFRPVGWSAHRRGVEGGILGFSEIVEPMIDRESIPIV